MAFNGSTFADRAEAGKLLAEKLAAYRGEDAVVYALPRGGVATGYEVAKALQLPLDILTVRKIGHPLSPEYAIGAVDERGETLLNEEETRVVDEAWLKGEVAREHAEAVRRSTAYREGAAPRAPEGTIAILVDDGVATGLTMRLAIRAAKRGGARKVVVAVPVASGDAVRAITAEGADEVIVLVPSGDFMGAVGAHYMLFEQLEDGEVIELLRRSRDPEREVRVSADGVTLAGSLVVPESAIGIVVFAHGSGSSRFSPRNAFVAEQLQEACISTLLIDLLTPEEDERHEARFDIDLLAERLGAVVAWSIEQADTKDLPVGLFGASTGAAAALAVAARLGAGVRAVVSRGGRPDLAMEDLGNVSAPTLLIVGGNDPEVRVLNEEAYAALTCEKKLEIVPGATHLFEEPGALEEVARLAASWFAQFLPTEPGDFGAPEERVPPRLRDRMEKPTRPPGKTRAGAEEGYRHLHRK